MYWHLLFLSFKFSFVCYIGIGSFGHFQASKSGVHKGGLERPLVKAGFVATRISVCLLGTVAFLCCSFLPMMLCSGL